MLRLTELRVPLDAPNGALDAAILERLGIAAEDLVRYTVFRRNYDARRRSRITLNYTLDIEVRDEAALRQRLRDDRQVSVTPDMGYRLVAQAPRELRLRPLVIGTGPCGLFAGLILAQTGFRPIMLERGRTVRERTRDTFALWRQGRLDPESNVQFGEGGAGTFSDGKLHSQISDPAHRGRKVLAELVKAGAPPEILYLGKPHIGTFRLVTVVENLRATIEALGGSFRFETRVDDLDVADGRVQGIVTGGGEYLNADHVVLAVGHSARDTFRMLFDRGVAMAAKAFSIGLRIEHPQSMIDRARFGKFAGHRLLGAADYKLVHHAGHGRNVYSFCMCPGGTVVAATSEAERVVTNGMSQYSRNERNANSALVVDIGPADYPGDALAGIAFQRHWESLAFLAGGGGYRAPSQRLADFLAGRPAETLGAVIPSYAPGVCPADLAACLPDYAIAALREAIPAFDRQIAGFAMDDALLTGVETRTSSPVRIERGKDFQSINVRGLYPAGEGAGYAGGILSAAIDGIKVAEAVASHIVSQAASQRKNTLTH